MPNRDSRRREPARARPSAIGSKPWITAALVGLCGVLLCSTAIAVYSILPAPRGSIPAIGGPFRLEASSGGVLDSTELAGKPYLIFFGFTHCPDVCPTTLAELSALTQDLRAEGRSIRKVFVTIDPERDTVASLRDYLSSFDDDVVGLTGSSDQIAAIAKKFRVYYKRVPLKDGDYTMDHSALVYVMDGQNRFVGSLPEARASARDMIVRVLDAAPRMMGQGAHAHGLLSADLRWARAEPSAEANLCTVPAVD